MTSLKQVVGAAIVDSLAYPSRLLVARRSAPPMLAGLWEFPGGKVEPGENCTQALHRELMEELGVSVRLGTEVEGPHEQGWLLNERAAMRVWMAELTSGVPRPLEDHDLLNWLDLGSAETLAALPWIPADYPIVAGLLAAIGEPVDTTGPAPGR
ncbi:(deoxy)nucleoside triphosphate pyrophosphohydrolase [Arthrobacter sp. H14]|uniref:(deoxy)nucleoside triphosphate pyrophosphohydrolase n=1 Tax=Arthrobacter sp. H14 TaxID=1312959 RepID=UPI00047EFCE2|nr:(deoxy)nucleoside triphosphate pyrophosphohydrolase [Arthrobacter sp. H14]